MLRRAREEGQANGPYANTLNDPSPTPLPVRREMRFGPEVAWRATECAGGASQWASFGYSRVGLKVLKVLKVLNF